MTTADMFTPFSCDNVGQMVSGYDRRVWIADGASSIMRLSLVHGSVATLSMPGSVRALASGRSALLHQAVESPQGRARAGRRLVDRMQTELAVRRKPRAGRPIAGDLLLLRPGERRFYGAARADAIERRCLRNACVLDVFTFGKGGGRRRQADAVGHRFREQFSPHRQQERAANRVVRPVRA